MTVIYLMQKGQVIQRRKTTPTGKLSVLKEVLAKLSSSVPKRNNEK